MAIHSAYTCELCGITSSGYVSEIAAQRAEIAHMEGEECPAVLDGKAHLELQIKRHHLAELEIAAREVT